MKFKTGDNVFIRTGADKGKTGTITKVLRKQGQLVVEGINKKIRHVKGKEGQAGERVEFFAPIDASNVAILDKNGKPSRIGYKEESGEKVLITRTTGEEIIIAKETKVAKKASAKKVAKTAKK